jgi:hypothetical protein
MSCKNKIIEKFAYNVKEFPYDFPDELIKAMKLISSDIRNLNVMGSFRIKSLIFSGDVDCMEIVKYENQAQALKKIVYNMLSSPEYGKNLIIGDIKCGDNKYKKLLEYIGTLENGTIKNYNPESIRLTIKNIHIPELSNLPDKITIEEWVKLKKFVSSFIAIRWKPEDIIKGYVNYNGENVDLSLSVYNSTTTKIDIYYNLYGKYTEMTNIFFDDFKPKEYFIKEIKTTLIMNYINGNILKSIKQIFSISRLVNDCNVIGIIAPFLVSPTTSLNSCISDLNVLVDMIDFGTNIYYIREKINTHLGTIILKLSTYYLDDIPTEIFDEINNLRDNFDNNEFKNIIEKINKFIKNIVEKNSIDFFNENKILKKKYLL